MKMRSAVRVMAMSAVLAITISIAALALFPSDIASDGAVISKDGLTFDCSESDLTAVVTGFEGRPYTDILIPDTVILDDVEYRVTGIADGAFKADKRIITVEFLGNREFIVGNNAFSGCSELESVIIPGLCSIGDYAFANCSKISKLQSSSTDSDIDLSNVGFFGVGSMRGMEFEGSFTMGNPGMDCVTISEGAFEDCRMDSVVVDCDVIIGESGFEDCQKLESFRCNGVIRSIEESAFEDNRSLVTVEADRILMIGEEAFEGCKSLTDIDLRGTEVSDDAFSGIPAHGKFSIGVDAPDGVVDVKKKAKVGENVKVTLTPGADGSFGDVWYSFIVDGVERTESLAPVQKENGTYVCNFFMSPYDVIVHVSPVKLEFLPSEVIDETIYMVAVVGNSVDITLYFESETILNVNCAWENPKELTSSYDSDLGKHTAILTLNPENLYMFGENCISIDATSISDPIVHMKYTYVVYLIPELSFA